MPLTLFGKTAMTVGLLSALACTGSTVMMTNHSISEDRHDRSIVAQLTDLSTEISSKGSGQQDVVSVIKGFNIASSATSVYASGTIESGYCLVGVDTRGELAETGIFYDSKNPDAATMEAKSSCNADFMAMPLVIGDGGDGSESQPDATDHAFSMIFGALGVSTLSLFSVLLPVSLRPYEEGEDALPVPGNSEKIDPPKQAPTVQPTSFTLPDSKKSAPEFTKEGVQHRLTDDVSLRTGPGSFYPQIAIAKNKTVVTTTGHASNGWYEVLAVGRTGWMNSEFLPGANPSIAIPAVATVPAEPVKPAQKVEKKEETPATRNIPVQSLLSKYESIRKEWVSYELDLVKVLDHPSITNLSVPATSNFHKALSFAGYLAENVVKSSNNGEAERFEEAVLDLDHKFKVMISEAKRLKWNSYSTKEQSSLRTAQSLLAMATNDSSTVHERQVAYKRLIKEIEGILVLPERAMLELEARISPALNPADTTEDVVKA